MEREFNKDGRRIWYKKLFEIGPGKVLASTVKRTIPDANVLSVGLAPQIDQALEMISD